MYTYKALKITFRVITSTTLNIKNSKDSKIFNKCFFTKKNKEKINIIIRIRNISIEILCKVIKNKMLKIKFIYRAFKAFCKYKG